MSISTQPRTITVALIGNPNTGKSTLFSALCGVRQRVANYPGVTVEKKVGQATFSGHTFAIVDLPGTYSLAPKSPDEMVAVDVLLGRRQEVAPPSVVLVIVDASNLERNFYLLSQVLELGLPTVVALNMVDVARDKGQTLDIAKLQARLPVPLISVQANRGKGLEELKAALASVVDSPPDRIDSPFPPRFQEEVDGLENLIATGGAALPRYLIERLLLDTSGYLAQSGIQGLSKTVLDEIGQSRERLQAAGLPVPAVEAMARYRWAGDVLKDVVQRPKERRVTFSDRLDRLLTHRVWGTLTFLIVMFIMFQAVFYVAEPAGTMMEWLQGGMSNTVSRFVSEGALRSLLNDGVIAGVGGVLVFLPQILTLFFFIALLEDCGYMARAAYLMDKLMSRIGLSGKSFIPLLSSFACAVPGIMATRVIENRRDRLVTILVAPLMSCSARLPVYTLFIAAFIPNYTIGTGWLQIPWLHGLVMFLLYLIGIVTGILVAWILKKTIFRGPTPPFVMELPSYKVPGVWIVGQRMVEQGWSFVRRAGTLILAISVLVWGLGYYPHDACRIDLALLQQQVQLESQLAEFEPVSSDPESQEDTKVTKLRNELAHVENEIAGAYLSDSYLGRMGHWIEPAVRPLGWDWKIGCAAIASFPAREVVNASLGVIYNLGSDARDEELQETLMRQPTLSIPVALSIMVFFALCAQCVSTLVVIRRETGSWIWPLGTFVYMTTLAYFGAMVTYQVGRLF